MVILKAKRPSSVERRVPGAARVGTGTLVMAGFVALSACSTPVVEPEPVCVLTVSASPASATLERGASQVLTATGTKSAECVGVQRVWRSESPAVAVVTRAGTVTGISEGVATIG